MNRNAVITGTYEAVPKHGLRRLVLNDTSRLAVQAAEAEFGPRGKGKKGKGKGKRRDSAEAVYEAIRGRAQKAGADQVAEYQFARCE